MATKTAVIVLHVEVLIWAIPPLSPKPPDFSDHNLTCIPPLFIIPLPDDIEFDPEVIVWNTISSWYFGSLQPLFCDMLCQDSRLHRFQIMLEPDLSTASLHVINTYEITPQDFRDGTVSYLPEYTICGDTLVSCYINSIYNPDTRRMKYQSGVYTGLTTVNGIISHGGPAAVMLLPDFGRRYKLFPCPTSGRFVRVPVDSDKSNSIAVLDFF